MAFQIKRIENKINDFHFILYTPKTTSGFMILNDEFEFENEKDFFFSVIVMRRRVDNVDAAVT